MYQISINSGTNLDLRGGKHFIKVVFDIKIKIGIFEISNVLNFNKNLRIFNLEANLGLTYGKYFIKIIFDIKIEIGIFETSVRPNVNKF